jgi:hypothetical protein
MWMLCRIESGFDDAFDGVPITVWIKKPVSSDHYIDVYRTRWNPQRVVGRISQHLHSSAV